MWQSHQKMAGQQQRGHLGVQDWALACASGSLQSPWQGVECSVCDVQASGASAQALTATVPGAQPMDTWQRGSLSSSQARMVLSLLFCRPLMVFVRLVMVAR